MNASRVPGRDHISIQGHRIDKRSGGFKKYPTIIDTIMDTWIPPNRNITT